MLILACDGLWDVMTTEEAVNTVREVYQSGEDNVLKIAEEMLDLALDKGRSCESLFYDYEPVTIYLLIRFEG